jgi:diguanylate cyclase (GGDEF)-like protein/PAS domain S-box-containing protein
MNDANTGARPNRPFERLVFVPVVGALLIVWGVAAGFKLVERRSDLERARTQLAATVSILADFTALTQDSRTVPHDERATEQTAAIWRALLQYPTANIWVTSSGRVSEGQQPSSAGGPYIFVEETRGEATVHAALPERDALARWRWEAWWGAGVLAGVSAAFLFLTQLLSRALRRRNAAETDAALARDREAQLTAFQTELQATVSDRTRELRTANARLETELRERRIAEDALREHDALLNAVTKSAGELLGTHGYEDAVAVVLELVSQTVGASRAQLNALTSSKDGHLHAKITQEWCAPGLPSTIDNPAFQNIDLTAHVPGATAPALSGHAYAFFVTDISDDHRAQYRSAQMQSFLQVPVMTEGRLWGALLFVDSARERRTWSWAETDALETLAGLIGVALIRARYVQELADANMIVQNSPTILYRLRGEPSLPLVYISQNVVKFGHDPAKLLAAANWPEILIDPADQGKFGAAMTKALQKGAAGGSIEFRLRTGDDTLRWVENRYAPVRDKLGRLVEIEGIIIDITERKVAEERIAQLARTDGLTGLANRTTFVERLRQAFVATRRGANPFAVLCLDLDHFKDVNDTLGHPVGDLLLKEIGDRLRTNTRESDVVARLGGDEFAVLQSDMDDPSRAGELADKILRALSEPYMFDGNEVRITVSIGIAPYASATKSPDAMLGQGDLALYRAKEQGRNQYRFHSEDLDTQVRERVNLTAELRLALERDQLELRYQPQVDVVSGEIVGVEALVRWRHPSRGLLAPAEFFAIAEQTGIIMAIGHWVLDRACGQLRKWRDERVAPSAITINLSLVQLKNARELVQDVVSVLKKWDLAASDLEFDVTEATLAQLKWTHNDVLTQLHRLGAHIAIDDFGTEYSSFDYLKSYNVSHLKIARALIARAVTDPERAEMIRIMITLARELDIGVMAEGVETEEQRALLVSTGSPTKAQGFYFSEPVNAERAGALLRQRRIEVTGQHSATAEPGSRRKALPRAGERRT